MTTRYLSAAETARLVRQALKAEFPGVKLSVRSKTYSGGASIDIGWTDGPRAADVDPVAQCYSGSGFDGMQDLKYSRTHYLSPDGRTLIAFDPNHGGAPVDNRALALAMPDGFEMVRLGADFVFCNRHHTNFDTQAAEADVYLRPRIKLDSDGRFGGEWVDWLAPRMVRDRAEGEGWEPVFRRVVLREVEE